LRQQRKRPDLRRQILGQEDSAMTACLETLRDDGIGTVRFEPSRLLDCRGGSEDLRAPGLHACDQVGRRQSKMKADHGRPELLQHLGGFGAERGASRSGRDSVRIDPVLQVIRPEHCSPGRVPLGAGLRWRVAEEIHVVGLGRPSPDSGQLVAHGFGAEHGAGQRAEAAGVGHRHRQSAALRAGHRRLDDRQLCAQKVLQAHCLNSDMTRVINSGSIVSVRKNGQLPE